LRPPDQRGNPKLGFQNSVHAAFLALRSGNGKPIVLGHGP
jgi:hypothetical protein